MRTSRHQHNPSREWLVLALAVGLSLTLLFFSRHRGVERIRGEMADVLSMVVQPFAQLGSMINMWQDYDEMRAWAMELSLENGMLRDAILENERLRAMLEFKKRAPLDLIPASVIARVTTGVAGRLRLNVGRIDGVELNSAVVTPRGLVGKITEVSDYTSLAQTLVGNSYGVSVMVERTRMTGIMRWRTRGEWVVLGLPSGADVKKGDIIVTSGAGSVFPKGIRAGIVTGALAADASYGQNWSVKPLVSFGSLEEVFVVTRSPQMDVTNDPDSLDATQEP